MAHIKKFKYSPWFKYEKIGSVSVLYILKMCVFQRIDHIWSFCGGLITRIDDVIFIFGKKIWQKK